MHYVSHKLFSMNWKKPLFKSLLLSVGSIFPLTSCNTIPGNAVHVSPFDLSRYLGRWYEIARLDFKYERNLNNTTADYSLNPDGTVRVVNRGYNYITHEEKEAVGKARFAGPSNEGRLKVSFFGPFYSAYTIIALDADYKYAMVAGKNLKYLWLLSREKTMPDSVMQSYLQKAKAIGYDTVALIRVEHNR